MPELHATEIAGTRLVAVTGDLTREDVDAIVNAANENLRHGGGVAGAIARAAGPAVQRESDTWIDDHGPLEDGQAAVTTAGELDCEIVIHVAGPVYDADRDDNEQRLRTAVRAALDAGRDHQCRSVALPAISAGVYGYPPAEATAILADEVAAFLEEHEGPFEEIRLVGLDEETTGLFADGIRATS